MASPTQQNRSTAIATPLGEDVLLLVSFAGREEIGRLFEYEVELWSEDDEVDFNEIIGGNVTVRLETTRDTTRYFNGIVNRFTQSPSTDRFASYRATIVPWLWLLTRTSDCRIWSGADKTRTVPEIIQEIFDKHGMKDFEDKLSGNYTPWDYCVQYRETDFNFISRLMEQEGIYYYFRHENGKHTLVLSDSSDAHAPFEKYDEIKFRPRGGGSSDSEHVRDWRFDKELRSGTYVHSDFDFENPKKDLRTEPATISRAYSHADFEIFDFPGEYAKPDDGKDWAKIRIQELQARYHLLHGQADVRGLSAGCTFELKDLPRQDQNLKYLVVSVNHSIHADLFQSSRDGGTEELYQCSFTVMPADEVFRPARITPKPLLQGPQTAMVVGPKGEEIHTDKYGRVKVKFHWDRYGKADENSSCWVRVAQTWAGKKWGAIYIPRMGQEVMVEFLEGDPDLPIITGRVYNAESMPPYDLPANATLSTLKSLSSKGGGGFNEIRFEDKKGEEQIFIHGEKNLDVRIKNDAFETIGNDQHIDVKKDQLEHIENNRNEIVDADHMEKIGKDRHLKVVGKEAKEVDGSLSLTVKGDVIEVFKANHSEQATGDYYLKADNVVIEAATNVTIKVGQSYIAIEASGVKIGTTGTLELEASGPLSVKSDAQIEIKAPQAAVSGDAMVTIKGGMVMIN